jgi:signal transduction histidine kinase
VRAVGDTHFEAIYLRKDGTEFPAEVRACYQEFDGGEGGSAGYFFTFAFDITARKKAEDAARLHLQRVESLALELTRSEERQRRELASILHDEVGQNLFAATTQLLALRNSVSDAQPATDRALKLLDQIAHDTRNLTFELCPPVLYQIGLAPALQRLLEQFTSAYGIKFSLLGVGNGEGNGTTFGGNGAGPKDLNVRGLAYQAVRELLNNAAKHSRARNVTVSLAERNGRLHVEVADDGEGFDPEVLQQKARTGQNGFGLFHLRERIGLLGGVLRINACPGKGCRIELELPLGAADEGAEEHVADGGSI